MAVIGRIGKVATPISSTTRNRRPNLPCPDRSSPPSSPSSLRWHVCLICNPSWPEAYRLRFCRPMQDLAERLDHSPHGRRRRQRPSLCRLQDLPRLVRHLSSTKGWSLRSIKLVSLWHSLLRGSVQDSLNNFTTASDWPTALLNYPMFSANGAQCPCGNRCMSSQPVIPASCPAVPPASFDERPWRSHYDSRGTRVSCWLSWRPRLTRRALADAVRIFPGC